MNVMRKFGLFGIVVLGGVILGCAEGSESLDYLDASANLYDSGECPVVDQCHEPGRVDSQTGTCTAAAKPDDTSCDDGNACTYGDSCQAGVCQSGGDVVCRSLDQCHGVGECDPLSGCANPVMPDDTTCGDGDACTKNDHCVDGVCVHSPVECGGISYNSPSYCKN